MDVQQDRRSRSASPHPGSVQERSATHESRNSKISILNIEAQRARAPAGPVEEGAAVLLEKEGWCGIWGSCILKAGSMIRYMTHVILR